MKKINVLFYLLGMLFLTGACEEQDNIEPIGNWELSAPVLAGPEENSTITLNQEEPNTAIRFDWQAQPPARTTG
ncbi:hypothetical protein [Rufibacter ruber]|uniref:hypothetical protein n=1 Tax=Rufibacter ruber TaxID=1783499 RepID=UPI000830E973|nr:hypothetical protein [Rufibacter ruber]